MQLFKTFNKFFNYGLCNSKSCVHLAINGSGSSVASQSMYCNRNLLYALPIVFVVRLILISMEFIVHQIIFVLATLKIYCILGIVNIPNLTVLN